MVEQMVSSNLSKYRLGNCQSIISTSDNHSVSLLKDTKLRDVQNDNKSPGPFEDSALQKEEAVTQAKSPPGSSNVNRNLVYARGKSDAELANSRTSDKNRITSAYQQAERQLDEKSYSPHQANESFAHIPVNSIATSIRSCENEESAMVNFLPAMEHWNARFAQLQKYLKQYDTSNQEVYLEKLRSFSPDECSTHAVELEKRAIKLTFDEGTEIQRVKNLNVLGNSSGNHLLLRPLTPVMKSENLV